MAVFVLPALFLRSLLGVVYYAVFDAMAYGNSGNESDASFHTLNNVSWANVFIYDLMTGAIFIGIGIVGCLRPMNAGVLQQKGYGNAPQHPMSGL